MRSEKLLGGVMAVLLAVALALGSIGCMVTGFGWEVPLATLAWACAIGALLGAVCGSLRVGMLPIGLLTLLCGYLWHKELLEPSVETLLYQISAQYNMGYGCGVFFWSEFPPNGDVILALGLFGVLAAAVLGWFLVKGWETWPAMVLALVPAVACLVLKDTVPGEPWLFTVLLAICLILLTQGTRKKDLGQSGKLTALLIIPTVAALILLFLMIPQEGYDRQAGAQALEDWVMQWFERPVEEVVQEVFSPSGTSDEQVNLKAVGPKQYQINVVMEVTAQETGPLYLRGQVYDSYDGLSWGATDNNEAAENYLLCNEAMELTVETKRAEDLLYLPYLSYNSLKAGKVENTKRSKDYTVAYTPLETYSPSWDTIYRETPEELEPFLQLPAATRRQARRLLPELSDTTAGGLWRYAQIVAEQVSDSAEYNLYTQRMPSGEEDFVLWFLEESDTGYCVHFASTAAVLLRAAGIPTRYVTGYLVSVKAGETVQVQQKDAHAWVEYYISGVGWQVLEATPAAATSPVPAETTEPATRPEPTEPSEETPATQQHQEATDSPVPSNPGTEPVDRSEKPAEPVKRELPAWLGTALWICLGVLAVPVQWQLRLWLRRKRFARGTANQQALSRFREIVRHSRVRRRSPEREIISLAQKAKFSQHAITEEELARMDTWLEASQKEFQSQKAFLQPVYTLLLALY